MWGLFERKQAKEGDIKRISEIEGLLRDLDRRILGLEMDYDTLREKVLKKIAKIDVKIPQNSEEIQQPIYKKMFGGRSGGN
jgi:hypothetical protein